MNVAFVMLDCLCVKLVISWGPIFTRTAPKMCLSIKWFLHDHQTQQNTRSAWVTIREPPGDIVACACHQKNICSKRVGRWSSQLCRPTNTAKWELVLPHSNMASSSVTRFHLKHLSTVTFRWNPLRSPFNRSKILEDLWSKPMLWRVRNGKRVVSCLEHSA